MPMRPRGFTLIELMVALSIAGFLLVMAAPLYAEWVADNQIKNGAQLIADGARQAQAEAIRRNVPIELVLDPTAKTGGWIIQAQGGGTIQQAYFMAGADRVAFAVTPAGRNTITFSPLGIIDRPNADATLPFDTVDITSTVSGTRALRVLLGGQTAADKPGRTGIKICDPAWTAIDPNDPKACPPAGG